MAAMTGAHEGARAPRLADLSVDQKAALTAGADTWHTVAMDEAGLLSIRLTDGPIGVRGHRRGIDTSPCLPCGTALAATWNPDLARRVGNTLGVEARRKGARVLLAPTVNIHRHPLAGRNFECYSEDPHLTAEMAVAYVEGVQELGVAATIKHFVCNDQEYERRSISAEVDERSLREVYLPPFEAVVKRGQVWALMSAYNRLHGTFCSEHRWLLTEVLREEWGFDGLVMSDWWGTHSVRAMAAGLDLEMPGPALYLGSSVADEVRTGALDESRLDAAVAHLRRIVERTSNPPDHPALTASSATVAREAAREALVLLRNDGVLPLADGSLRSLAVIGPNAAYPSVQGGGSAGVAAEYLITPLAGLTERAGAEVTVTHALGCVIPGPIPSIERRFLRTPTGAPGLLVEYFDTPRLDGQVLYAETITYGQMAWRENPAPNVDARHVAARLSGEFLPDQTGLWQFGLASGGRARLLVNGRVVVDNTQPQPEEQYDGRWSHEVLGDIDLEGGQPCALTVEFWADPAYDFVGVRLGARLLAGAEGIAAAAAAAAQADVAVVVVGTNNAWETEGYDRTSMDLPGEQDALIRAVAAANPRTLVVVNSGAPVTMPWADEVAAILQIWFPGQECGRALADVVFGDVDASGRLPTTFPRVLDDVSSAANYPGTDGTVTYREGIFVGYRHFDTQTVAPRFPFGHGLSYTTFEMSRLHVERTDRLVRVSVDVTNTGARPGQEVVQVYVHKLDTGIDRPDRELRAFAKLAIDPGQTRTVTRDLTPRAFAHWDVSSHGWQIEPGEYDILVGASSRDIRQRARVSLADWQPPADSLEPLSGAAFPS